MESKSTILRHLPELRRFASAVTGSTEQGDFLISCLLIEISQNKLYANTLGDTRMALFQRLICIYDDHTVRLFRPNPAQYLTNHNVRTRLIAIPMKLRQIFLLVVMESFSIEETSKILGISINETKDQYREATSYVSKQLVTDILILGSDEGVVNTLRRAVLALGHRVTDRVGNTNRLLKDNLTSKHRLVILDCLAEETVYFDRHENRSDTLSDVPVLLVEERQSHQSRHPYDLRYRMLWKPLVDHEIKSVVNEVLFFNSR
jgi:hypothetical protein